MADGPQVGKHRQEQRLLQEFDPERAACSLLAADGSLHKLDVAIAPFLQALVEIGHQLKENAQILPFSIKVQQRVQIRFALVRSDTMQADERMKGIVDRGLIEAALQTFDGFRIVLLKCQHLGPPIAEKELQLAELHALKARGRFEPGAETIKRQGRQRFEDIDLADQRFQDRSAALEGGNAAVEVAAAQVVGDFLQFVQQQLEPQLVDLVNDDEEHLVVLGRLRQRSLEDEQFVEFEIAGISKRHDRVRRLRPSAGVETAAPEQAR